MKYYVITDTHYIGWEAKGENVTKNVEIFKQVMADKITMSKGAELSGLKLSEFRKLFNCWVAYWDGYHQAAEVVLDTIKEYGGIDGSHHKQWLLDLIVRKVTGDDYAKWVAEYEDGEDGPQTYLWDQGIAP